MSLQTVLPAALTNLCGDHNVDPGRPQSPGPSSLADSSPTKHGGICFHDGVWKWTLMLKLLRCLFHHSMSCLAPVSNVTSVLNNAYLLSQ